MSPSAFGPETEADRLRADVAALSAERDALTAKLAAAEMRALVAEANDERRDLKAALFAEQAAHQATREKYERYCNERDAAAEAREERLGAQVKEFARRSIALKRERLKLRTALALAEVEVALERTWCRICRTESRSHGRSREAHPHAASCALAAAAGEATKRDERCRGCGHSFFDHSDQSNGGHACTRRGHDSMECGCSEWIGSDQ